MECFAHPGVNGVGVCKGCGKAVCRNCARDLGFAIACSEACAKEATDLHQVNQRSKRLVDVGRSSGFLSGGVFVYGLFAVFFLGWALVAFLRSGAVDGASIGIGVLFVIVGVVIHRRAKKITSQ